MVYSMVLLSGKDKTMPSSVSRAFHLSRLSFMVGKKSLTKKEGDGVDGKEKAHSADSIDRLTEMGKDAVSTPNRIDKLGGLPRFFGTLSTELEKFSDLPMEGMDVVNGGWKGSELELAQSGDWSTTGLTTAQASANAGDTPNAESTARRVKEGTTTITSFIRSFSLGGLNSGAHIIIKTTRILN
ncbi:hypothetical protein PPACK8108_LOCUS13082 [Phakopsora pachyrhizi]|uniref:Uncharacterized protein n=1 Tax=Phakopsora pachyrhizi TaxID=170000 RepID=A0AAV0B315_PHAPC|nr:hypothetical protein PPACK8108_LOCUS13082 [Phakopsora pachyrhizi]